jgi:hypothetical protein
MRSASQVRTCLVVAALIVGVSLAGCSKKSDPQTAPTFLSTVSESPGPTASGAAGTTTGTATPNPTTTSGGNSGPTYPASAKSYAQSLLSAWAGKNFGRLDQLAIQSAVQQIKDNGYPNSVWTFIKCDNDGSATSCLFRNAHGDEVIVKMMNNQLGHPTAVTEALLSKTTYANDAGGYVGQFIYAWQQGNKQRMIRLANSTVTNFFLSKSAPTSSMVTSTDNTAGHTKITISVDGGTASYTFNVANQYLGKAHAIEGLCNPGCA